jgi:hypothetical protein
MCITPGMRSEFTNDRLKASPPRTFALDFRMKCRTLKAIAPSIQPTCLFLAPHLTRIGGLA